MPYTYGFVNQKGGVGKTTLAIHQAAELAELYPDARVALFDGDPNATTQRWANLRDKELPFSVFGAAMENLHRQFATLSRGYDFVVIDGPANMTKLNGSIIMCADTVIVPIKPAGFDQWSADELYQVFEGLQGDSGRKICTVMTMVIRNSVISRNIRESLEKGPIHLLQNQIHNSVVLAEMASTGLTAKEIAGKSNSIVREIKAVINEIMEFSK